MKLGPEWLMRGTSEMSDAGYVLKVKSTGLQID